jgi:signal transduction histidine kinase/ActR/RegA family two-component response regulator
MTAIGANRDARVLVLATGRDGDVVMSALGQEGLSVESCADLPGLASALADGAGAALIADDALTLPDAWTLIEAVRRQPAWSDIPLLILTSAETDQAAPGMLRTIDEVGNATLLERPIRRLTLRSAMRSALRARRRQYEFRDHLDARQRAQVDRERLLARERAARAEVQAANRAKDEFLAVLSHELRTPLQSIIGWVKLLHHRSDPDTLRRGLDTIERNARAQAQIVEDLLDVSRVIAGTLGLDERPLALGPVIESAIDAVRAAAGAKGVRIDTTLPTAPAIVNGDGPRLQQVVWNLLTNAVQFTPAGGSVTVQLQRAGASAEIRVTDTGQGIPRALLRHIFERFRQADSTSTRRHGGLGLGLAIVRHLVELHGGAVSAVSEGEGRGATFTVTLPLIPDAAMPADDTAIARGASAITAPALQGRRILVVDDDSDTCELLARVLGYYGAEVTTASSAEEALRAVERVHAHVVVSDIAMPGVDGYGLVRQLRALEEARGWRVPALALTAHARAADSERAFMAGFAAYVAKPVEPAELAELIARLAAPDEGSEAR